MTLFMRLLVVVIITISWPAFSQGESSQAILPSGQDSNSQTAPISEQDGSSQTTLSWTSPLVLIQSLWMVLIAIGAPLYSKWACKKSEKSSKESGESSSGSELRGLNLPRGSIRSMLALLAVGSFVNVLVLGAPVLGEHFDSILAAFGTLTGSIIGFYFGNRSATPLPSKQ